MSANKATHTTSSNFITLLKSLKELHMCTKTAEEVQCGLKEEVLSGLRKEVQPGLHRKYLQAFHKKSGRPAEHF